jgi:hypothetical protein
VVGLGDKRPAAARKPLQQHDAPQRTRAIEAMRPEVGGPLEQLALVAGPGQRCARDVHPDVEALVGLPLGPAQAAGGPAREPLAVARQGVEAPLEVAAHAGEGGRSAAGQGVEDQHRTDVHVGGGVGVLELEEGRVERRQGRAHAQTKNAAISAATRTTPEKTTTTTAASSIRSAKRLWEGDMVAS